VKPLAKAIPVDHHVPSPAASHTTQIRPVSAGDRDEPLATFELLGRHDAAPVDEPAARGRARDRQRQHSEDGQLRLFGGPWVAMTSGFSPLLRA
jgi:hypothetical protein